MPSKGKGVRTSAVSQAPAGPTVEAAMAEMARQVQALTAALAARPLELEAKVAALEAETMALRAEREHLLRLKVLYERKFEALKPKD